VPPESFDNFYAGGGASSSSMSSVAAAIIVIAIVLLFLLPRRNLVFVVLFSVLLVPSGNVLVIPGAHLMPIRLIVLFGWMRLIASKLSSGENLLDGGMTLLDKVLLSWAVCRSLAAILLWQSSAMLVDRMGFLWSVLGMYFLLRCLIQSDDDIAAAVKACAILAAVIAVGMVGEQIVHRNIFSALVGGVESVPLIRDGRVRAQGTFEQPILAGAFGATLIPLCVWLWSRGNSKVLPILGISASLVMVVTSASSTPVLALAAALGAFLLWPVRKRMRVLRWGILLILVLLHLAMKVPVWFLIARVDVIGASAGFDRAYLIDTFVRHFNEWWLVGTKSNANWGWSMWDTSNQFVEEGNSGGLATFILFIAIISICFRGIGLKRKQVEGNRQQEWLVWALGAALLAHCAAFFGVSYWWNQMQVAWFLLLAIICASIMAQAQIVPAFTVSKTMLPPGFDRVKSPNGHPVPSYRPQTPGTKGERLGPRPHRFKPAHS
jgi:hypothetical protein